MKRRLITKKKHPFKKIFLLIIFLIIIILLNDKKTTIMNKTELLNNLYLKLFENYYFKKNNQKEKLDFLVNYSFGYKTDYLNSEENQDLLGDFVTSNNKKNNDQNPLVYIYNTHQTETYNRDITTAYNIEPTVKVASYILQEKLNNLNIPTIVEEDNIKEILTSHNWLYKDSYKASRILLESAYNNHPSLKIFIDLHRDSSNYETTTYKSNDRSYAKLLFVVGLDYEKYDLNLQKATRLNEIIKDDYPFLSRGIYKKTGKRVNGIYNQDFKENTFLIEVGGQYNSIEEVKNTIEILAKCIQKYVMEYEHET